MNFELILFGACLCGLLSYASLSWAQSTTARPSVDSAEESVRKELVNLLKDQFLFIDWTYQDPLADLNVATGERSAVFMIHDSLLSHVTTVRCPTYAMVFSWFADERRNAERRLNTNQRTITRQHIQMLAYRVVIEQDYYHDIFLTRVFASQVHTFMDIMETFERHSNFNQDTDIKEVWYDLIGCLYDYANMITLDDEGERLFDELIEFLDDPVRKRLALRMRDDFGMRAMKLSLNDLRNVHDLSISMPHFDNITELTIAALMDESAFQDYAIYRAAQGENWQPSVAEPEILSLWPEDEPIPAHDRVIDYEPVIYRFTDGETQRWATPSYYSRLADLDNLAPIDPRLSQLSPAFTWINSQAGNEFSRAPRRSQRNQLEDIAAYYHLRMQLAILYEHSQDSRLMLWARLKPESAIEITIIDKLCNLDHNNLYSGTVMTVNYGLELYRALVDKLSSLIYIARNGGSAKVQSLANLIRPLLNYIQPMFEIGWIQRQLKNIVEIADFMGFVEQVYRETPGRTGGSGSADEHQAQSTSVTADTEDCSICLNALEAHFNEGENKVPIRLHCSHKYHLACMLRWFRQGAQTRHCPLCRSG